jgi:hypothetical protein
MFPEPSQMVSQFLRETGHERELAKIKFRGTVDYVRSGERVLLGPFRETSPKGLFRYASWYSRARDPS